MPGCSAVGCSIRRKTELRIVSFSMRGKQACDLDRESIR
jgi:hypothetical protein